MPKTLRLTPRQLANRAARRRALRRRLSRLGFTFPGLGSRFDLR